MRLLAVPSLVLAALVATGCQTGVVNEPPYELDLVGPAAIDVDLFAGSVTVVSDPSAEKATVKKIAVSTVEPISVEARGACHQARPRSAEKTPTSTSRPISRAASWCARRRRRRSSPRSRGLRRPAGRSYRPERADTSLARAAA